MTANQRRTGSLGSRRRWMLGCILGGVWLSGAAWILLHSFFAAQNDFGPVPNRAEPSLLQIHGAFAFASIWLFGLLWGIHIDKLWVSGRKRWSGSLLTAAFLFLIATGYLLYYVGNDKVRPLVSALHWGFGLASPFLLVFHRFKRAAVPPPANHRETPVVKLTSP